ncbi:MAG: Fic family protein [Patescibacteria group bacterium]
MNPHKPNKLPVELDFSKFARSLSNAQYSLGRLDGLQKTLLNPNLLLAPLTTKEAAVSSKIEGTQSTVSDIFLYEAGEKTEHRDIIEVVNYKRAVLYAIEQLKKKPLNLNLIKDLHRILLENARRHGTPGEFRKEQVWIGERDAPIEEATYLPPRWETIPEHMSNLEKYVNSQKEDVLVQAALAHYQFEAIHPFYDGNGRIGRLLIPLILYSQEKISQPILYMSGYFEKNRNKYTEALHNVDETDDYESWISFFMEATAIQAEETQKLIENILSLHQVTMQEFENSKSPYIPRLIDFLFKKPIFRTSDVVDEIGAHRSTVTRLLDKLIERNTLDELKIGGRKRVFAFRNLLRIL